MVPSCVAWHPREPHDKLLVGCENACCVLVQYVADVGVQDRLQVCSSA